jgi:TonB family protein
MKVLTFFAFLLISTTAICQDTVTMYFDARWKESTPENSMYHRKKFKVGNYWGAIDYYKSGAILKTGTFTDDSCKKNQGESIWYSEKGEKTMLITYTAGELDGKKIIYYAGGKVSIEGFYKMGKNDGDWAAYYESGKISGKAHYENGEQTNAEFYNEDGSVNKKINAFEQESEFPGGTGALSRFLSSNLHYPTKAFKAQIEGRVIVQFIVDKEGKVTNIEVIKSVDESLDKEAIRVVSKMPAWSPAIWGGKYVKSFKRLPIDFKLQ